MGKQKKIRVRSNLGLTRAFGAGRRAGRTPGAFWGVTLGRLAKRRARGGRSDAEGVARSRGDAGAGWRSRGARPARPTRAIASRFDRGRGARGAIAGPAASDKHASSSAGSRRGILPLREVPVRAPRARAPRRGGSRAEARALRARRGRAIAGAWRCANGAGAARFVPGCGGGGGDRPRDAPPWWRPPARARRTP